VTGAAGLDRFIGLTVRFFCRHRRHFVERLGLSLFKFNGACRAFADARPKPVAIGVVHDAGLPVYNLQSPFMAARDAGTAPVAEFLIDFYNRSFHFSRLFCDKNRALHGKYA
jgi:hypothetical protein